MPKIRLRFPTRRPRPLPDALAALATLSCSITIANPQQVADEQYGEAAAREQQVVEKMIHALQERLETPLVNTGWRTNNDGAAMPRPKKPAMIDPSNTGLRIDVPGVPLAIQLANPSGRQPSHTEVETKLYFDNRQAGRSLIVNMVVYIRATAQVTAELLKKIDWQRVGEGLTP